MLLTLIKLLLLLTGFGMGVAAVSFSGFAQSAESKQKERDRAYARQQFSKNFHDLQITSQSLLKEHEEKRLTPDVLAKNLRTINKSAKALRTLAALGNLALPQKIDKGISTAQQFDQSIRRLAKLVYDFAHNPIHQNSKVFNTDQAQQAQTDLLAIIDLSKAIENNAKNYQAIPDTSK
ncbi:MAG: hypothetical protein ACKVZH_01175 [Blastocatellia bacterium]